MSVKEDTFFHHLSTHDLELDPSSDVEADESETKGNLESNISSLTDKLTNGTSVPDLVHTKNGSSNTNTERKDGSVGNGQLGVILMDIGVVVVETSNPDEVGRQVDGGVDSQPVADNVHEVINELLKGVVGGDRDTNDSSVTNNGPGSSRNQLELGPDGLGRKTQGVHVGNVVSDGRESQNNDTELAKAVERVSDENLKDKSSNTVLVVTLSESRSGSDTGHAGSSESHTADKRSTETQHEGAENLDRRGLLGHVDGVVSSRGTPSSSETKDSTTERENIGSLRGSNIHGSPLKGVRSSHLDSNDKEDDSVGDPGPLLVVMNKVVAHERDTEGQERDNDNGNSNRKAAVVHSVEHLGRHNGVDRTPTDTGDTVEKCKEPDSLVSKPVSREHHLSETKLGAEGGVEGNRSHTENVEEDDSQKGVDEMQLEDGNTQATKSERSNNHVGGKPHGSGVPDGVVGLLLLGNSVDTSNLSLEMVQDPEEHVVGVRLDVLHRAMVRVFERGGGGEALAFYSSLFFDIVVSHIEPVQGQSD